jgi:hypothetical protein
MRHAKANKGEVEIPPFVPPSDTFESFIWLFEED